MISMTRPRRSSPGIAFAAVRAGRFYPGNAAGQQATARKTLDILAVGRSHEHAARTRRTVGVLGGAALVALALSTRGFLGAVLGLGGAALLVRGVTGRSLRDTARLAIEKLASGPEDERVDQASWESFPASDPPAHSPAKG